MYWLSYCLNDPGFKSRCVQGIILLSRRCILILGPQSPLINIYGEETHSWGLKRPERKADHSPPSSAEVRNYFVCILTPNLTLMSYTGTNLPSKGVLENCGKLLLALSLLFVCPYVRPRGTAWLPLDGFL